MRGVLPVIDNIRVGHIAPSPIHGLGLFARQDISAGTPLAILDGQLVPWETYRAAAPANDAFNEWNALAPDLLLVRPFRTKYSFINHARTPNCRVTPTDHGVVLTALCPIPQDTELTLDYRMEPLPPAYLAGHGAAYL